MSRELCPVCEGKGWVTYKPSFIERLLGGSTAVKVCPKCNGAKWIGGE